MRKLRQLQEVNAGSMADIAFLLLIFFLVTTTMDVDTGITRSLPPPIEDDTDIDIKERNVFKVLVNSADNLLVEGREGSLSTLKDETKYFMRNPNDDPNLPEKRLETINLLGEVWISRGVVSLKNDRGTSYDMYIRVQNELTAAFRELREELSIDKFGTRFDNLTDDQKKAIQSAVPVAISEAEPEDIGGYK